MVSVYLPPLTGLLNFVALDGLWGAPAPAARAQWRGLRLPRTLWTPAPRPARAVWGKEG